MLDPAPAVAKQVVVVLAHPRGDLRVELERDRRGRHGHGNAGGFEDPRQPPHARPASILVVGLRALVALGRLDSRVGVLSPTVVAIVAPQHRVLGALLVDQHHVHHDPGIVRPREPGW